MGGDRWEPGWVVAPGEIIREEMAERGWSLHEAAERFRLSEPELEAILSGTGRIREREAGRIGAGFGTKADIWMALEGIYRDGLAAGKERLP